MPRTLAAALALALPTLSLSIVTPVDAAPAETSSISAKTARGTVLKSAPLKKSLWISGVSRAYKLTYVTTDTFGKKAASTGTIMIPKGTAPKGGWPVISWAHGTIGIGDRCAPSNIGPALAERDNPYLAQWLKAGYAIVASDYAGLGTPGLHAYLDGRTTAHNVVDMVTAGRSFSAAKLPATAKLSKKWAAVGQSQGGGAAIYTARYATEFGGKALDYRGAAGTGTPAYVENLFSLPSAKVPPVALTPALTAYAAYTYAALRYAHPELKIDDILTPQGRKVLKQAESQCIVDLEETVKSEAIGDWFTAPVAARPGWTSTINSYMAMPSSGFDKPFFMGNGALDIDVPFALTLVYATGLQAGGEPVTFKVYPSDHSGTLTASPADSIPFITNLMK